MDYHPQVGLHVHGTRGAMELVCSDVLALPHGWGHVSIEEAFGKEPRRLSDRDFISMRGALTRRVRSLFYALVKVGQILGMTEREIDLEFSAMYAASRAKQLYHPDDLCNALLDIIEDRTGTQNLKRDVHYCGILNIDPNEHRRSVVRFFYLFHRIHADKHGHPRDTTESTVESLKSFPFSAELLEEYHRRRTADFGDTLLYACEEYERWLRAEQENT